MAYAVQGFQPVPAPVVDISADLGCGAGINSNGAGWAKGSFGYSTASATAWTTQGSGRVTAANYTGTGGTGGKQTCLAISGAVGQVNDMECPVAYPIAMTPAAGIYQTMMANMAVCRFQVLMAFATSPLLSGMCQRDTGVAFLNGGFSGYMKDTTVSSGSGGELGFGLFVDQPSGLLAAFVVNASGATAPSVNTPLVAPKNGYLAPFFVEARVTQGTPGGAASFQAYLDNVLIYSNTWASANMPLLGASGVGTVTSFLPRICNASSTTANPLLYVLGARMRIGSLLSVMQEY